MSRFDRYLLSQLLMLFGFFALVLVSVYWVNRAVRLFDQLISSGESAMVFLEFTALILPNVIRVMMPIAAFAATLYAINRLSSESELVVVQSTGFSPWRLARPVVVFGLIVAGLASILNHALVPLSISQFATRQAEVAENVTARLLTEGTFLNPSDGVTFYIREISPVGELLDVFMSDAREDDERLDYVAERALLVRGDEGPTLLMFDGMVQRLDEESNLLSVTRFTDLTFDIGALIEVPTGGRRDVAEISTIELLTHPPEVIRELGVSPQRMTYEANLRIAQALMCLTAPLVGFAVMMAGGFSRFGMWRQVVAAIAAIVLIELMNQSLSGTARSVAGAWPLTHAGALTGLVGALLLLWAAANPQVFRAKRPVVEDAA